MSNDDLPSKTMHETIGFCVNCDANRVIGKHGECINCGSKSIYRNGVGRQLEEAKIKYEARKRKILEGRNRPNFKYMKEAKLNDQD